MSKACQDDGTVLRLVSLWNISAKPIDDATVKSASKNIPILNQSDSQINVMHTQLPIFHSCLSCLFNGKL